MSKLSYRCGWKSISLNEQKNQTISTRRLLLTWIMGKQTSSIERSCFSVFKIVKKIKPKSTKIKSLFVCLGKVLNPYHFLQS